MTYFYFWLTDALFLYLTYSYWAFWGGCFCIFLWQDSIDMTGSDWEREMGGGNGKGPRGGIRSPDTRSVTTPYVGALPTRLLVLTVIGLFLYLRCFVEICHCFLFTGPSPDTVMERIQQVSRTLEEYAICPDLHIDLSCLAVMTFDLENKFKPFRGEVY